MARKVTNKENEKITWYRPGIWRETLKNVKKLEMYTVGHG
jgi:hypothetical protein